MIAAAQAKRINVVKERSTIDVQNWGEVSQVCAAAVLLTPCAY